MRLLTLFQAVALTFGFLVGGLQGNPTRVEQYDVILYDGASPASYSEEAKKEMPPEKPLLTIRGEEGEKFHAEGNGAVFEGKILSVKGDEVEVRIKRSRLGSTSTGEFTKSVKFDEDFTATLFGFSSIVRIYYFRVKRVSEEGAEGSVK
jgi:hypothetical protein